MIPNTKIKNVAQALEDIKGKLNEIGEESLKSIEILKHSKRREKDLLSYIIHINYLAHEAHDKLTHQVSDLRFVETNVIQDNDDYLVDEDPTQWG